MARGSAINGAPRRKKRTVRTSSSPTAWPASPWRCKARARSSRISRLTPGSITVQSTGAASADGKTYEGLKVTTSDLEILLLLDGNHRLMRLEVPDAKVSVIRE